MEINVINIKMKGKDINVPSMRIDDKTVVAIGRFIKIAAVHDEEWLEGEVVNNPEQFIHELKISKLNADIFSFAQKIPDTQPRYKYHMEWDNVAVIPITTFENWWKKRLPQVTRKSVRRGYKRGIVAKVTEFDDEFVKGIVGIHNNIPMKQGTPFAHYGKEFNIVKRDYGTYLDRSEFLGAYYQSELIGMIKFLHLGKIASIMQIITMDQHYDKRPTNILIAKTVEVCKERGKSHLVYGKYVYGNKTDSSLSEFKRRNGFEQINFPRYYVPLTLKGRIAIMLKLHLGLLGILPSGVISFLRDLRSRYYRIKLLLLNIGKNSQSSRQNDELPDTEDDAN